MITRIKLAYRLRQRLGYSWRLAWFKARPLPHDYLMRWGAK